MDIINLESDKLIVKVSPLLGGRVDSIIYKPTQKNWVWKNTHLKDEPVSKYLNYDDNWQGGWEELYPNDAIENFSWGKGLDHGELWSASWDIDFTNTHQVKLSTKNLDSGTVFYKSINIKENTIKVDYKADIKFIDNFLFKLHLAVPIDENTEVICDFQKIEKVDKNFGNILENDKKFFKLKKNSGDFDFAYIDLNKKGVIIKDSLNNSMKLNYGEENLKYFWMFQSQGGWRGHNVLVLEPSSNSKKYLLDAAKDKKVLKGPLKFNCNYSVEFDND